MPKKYSPCQMFQIFFVLSSAAHMSIQDSLHGMLSECYIQNDDGCAAYFRFNLIRNEHFADADVPRQSIARSN